VAALAIVELEVDELVDEILEDLVVGEVFFGPGDETIDLGGGGTVGEGWGGDPGRAGRGAARSRFGRCHRTAAL
jgi:hypothetical protein